MPIPQPFIDDLLDRVDIVELVDGRVKLKKSGKNYSACCPFHDEKTPSFTVSQDKQFYYCFGCGASGNAIGFLMNYDRFGFREAVEQLAKLCGLDLPDEERNRSPEQIAKEQDRKTIYSLLEAAATFYKQQLRSHPNKHKAVGYLQNRGLSGEIARDFCLGYAPPGWDNLLQALGQNPEDQRLLIDGGMLINREEDHKLYDRFRDRIIFPIHDIRGRVIGFGGRVLSDEKPKYLNSPESPVFHKGEELYGLYEARQRNSQLKNLLVVEGYMDVVALAQFGIDNAVATLGTACREDHLIKAFKYAGEIVFCFDGDNAGRMAARRALEASIPVMTDGRQVKFLFLPEGEDPDTLVRQIGAKKFNNLIDHALPLESFFFDALTEDLDPQSMEGRARLSKLAAPWLNKLPKGVYRELMFDQLAKRTGLEKNVLVELVEEVPIQTLAPETESQDDNKADSQEPPPEDYESYYESQGFEDSQPIQRKAQKFSASKIKLPPQRLLALLLLHNPGLAKLVEELEKIEVIIAADQSQDNDSSSASSEKDLVLFVELVKLLQQRPKFTTGQIIGHLQGTYGDEHTAFLNELNEQGAVIRSAQLKPDYDASKEFLDALKKITRQFEQRDHTNFLDEIKKKPFAELNEEEKLRYKQALLEQATLKDSSK